MKSRDQIVEIIQLRKCLLKAVTTCGNFDGQLKLSDWLSDSVLHLSFPPFSLVDDPTQPPAPEGEQPDDALELQKAPRIKRVLIVDDEQVIADTLVTILNMRGYHAEAAYNAQSGLERCGSFRPDLILSDVVMPGMNGVEMAILVRQHYPWCKIILFSGQAATTSFLDEALQKGHHFEVLAKPIHPNELLEILARAISSNPGS